ncbi:MAG TPA: single-stranded DNA-binding protein [Ktedonobacteraceae bacterium]|nr:single-stranded DNA-binding protein [Ktedonobacteraceae bacterium]
MATFNQVTFIGRLGKDPEMNYTPNGKAVTKFSLAVDQGKDQKAMWLNIVCWNELAERMGEFLHKGMQVFVQGRLLMRPYTDKNNVERLAVEVIASAVQVLEKRSNGSVDPSPVEEDKEPF